jgi:hypothetical protein
VEVRDLRLTPFFYRGAVLGSHGYAGPLGRAREWRVGQAGDKLLLLCGSPAAASGYFVHE